MTSKSQNEALEALLRGRPKALDTPQRRAAYDAQATLFPLAPDVHASELTLGGVRCESTVTAAARQPLTVVYLHGGGYVYGSLQSHRHLASELGRQAQARAVAVDYRRAPEAPFPAALDDALAAWQGLLASGIAADQMALAGDSAGGGLAVALMVRLRELGREQPATTVLFSPWVDMLASGASYTSNAARDPTVNRSIIDFCARQYIGEALVDVPLASPVRADLRGLAPLTIYVGATETLLDDSIQLARQAGLADVRVRLEIWPAMFHIWPSYHQMLDDGRKALVAAGEVLRQALQPAPRHPP